MATIAHSELNLSGVSAVAKASQWEALAAASLVGDGVDVAHAELSVTVQAFGTWGGATLTLRGSNKANPAPATAGDWFTLKNALGTAATMTADGGLSLSDLPLWVSPILSGGGGTEDIDVILVAR